MKWLGLVLVLSSACATTSSTVTPVAPEVVECPKREPATTDEPLLPWQSRIEKVCLLGASADDALRLTEFIAPREGQTLSPELVSEDLRGLVDTGFVQHAKAVAQRVSGGVVLIYVVKQYARVGDVSFEGTQRVDVGALRDVALKTVWASPRALRVLNDELNERVRELGFSSGNVALESKLVGEKVNVHFVVTEGPQDTLKSVTFVGNKRVKEVELRKSLRVAVDTPWNAETAAFDEQQIQALYLDRGMINAKVSTATTTDKATGAVALTFTILEGEQFTFGVLKVQGGSDKELKNFESKTGRVFSRSSLMRDVEKLKSTGVSVTPEVQIDQKRQRVDVTFVVMSRE